MEIQGYLPRIGDRILEKKLRSSGAVLIEGAKWCGKTSTALRRAESVLYMQDPDTMHNNLLTADTKPSILLQGPTPRLIDEWQMAPVLWDAARFAIDQRGGFGHFIFTGSAVPTDDATAHTGVGRFSRMTLRPMSLFESGDSTGSVSLSELFDNDGNKDVEGISNLDITNIANIICRGGWPTAVIANDNETAFNYVEMVINTDLQRVDGAEKNPSRVRQMLRSLSRNISTLASMTTIKDDMAANDEAISQSTFYSYLNALKRIFLVEDVPAWRPSLRSKSAIRAAVKHQFVDPSIATAVMRLTPESMLNDMEYFGFLFESLATRDLRIYSDAIDGEIYHYHDSSELEADAVIRLHNGKWALVEVKLGSKQIEEAATHLLALKEKIDTDKVGEPSFLMIITGGQYALKRKDGVLQVPLGCLKE